MIKLALLLFGWLIPPLEPTGNDLLKWRVTVGVVAMTNSLAIGGAVALSLGLVPLIFPGFVTNTAVADLKHQISLKATQQDANLNTLQVNQLDSKILDMRSRQCGAMNARKLSKDPQFNDNVIYFTTERLYQELREYYTLTKMQYRLPKCEEL